VVCRVSIMVLALAKLSLSRSEAVCRQGLEGVVAKRLDSCYRPGKRAEAWIKIKPKGLR
jgi:ATP-dependent DNA ligase